jgi:hypothetical protein
MTNDELLAIVEDLNKLIRKQMKAIDTVLNLHKEENGWCLVCNYPYPCKTIQDVEEQLK